MCGNRSDDVEIQVHLVFDIRLAVTGGAQEICKIETGLNFDEPEEPPLSYRAAHLVVPSSPRRMTFSQTNTLPSRSSGFRCGPRCCGGSTYVKVNIARRVSTAMMQYTAVVSTRIKS